MLLDFFKCGLTILIFGLCHVVQAKIDDTVSGQRDHSVVLACPIDVTSCGELHSVKWFKGEERIAVVSGDGELANIKDEYRSRMSIDHSPSGPITRLHIKSLQINDENIYICESTFLDPLDTCDIPGAYRIEVKVEVPPSLIQLSDENGNIIRNLTTLGPLREGHTLKTICVVKGTRPVPSVGWYRNGKRLTDALTIDEANGLFSVQSELSLVLSRQELGTHIECRIESSALANLVSNHIILDLQVRPTMISLTGVEHHVVQGTKVLLECKVKGARPAVNVTWSNSSTILDPQDTNKISIETKTTIQNDGTFDTISRLVFKATRYENDRNFRCEADNIVMRADMEKPIHDTLVLEVLYPPVVVVKPQNITINETSDFLLFCEYEANPASLEQVIWRKNTQLLKLNQPLRYEGGNSENTALLVKNATREDSGDYTCELSNAVGSDVSDNSVTVDVQFVPVVELSMEPDTPIIENDEANVTLYCNVIEGNPTNLLKVRWYLEGSLLKELPECNTSSNIDDEDLCNVDPSKLLLQNIGREFLGSYSCEGLSAAGWGVRSTESNLIVYYEPGNATLIHHPPIPVKKKSVTFSCSVDDGGNPNATRFHWLRGGRPVLDVVTPIYTVDPVGLDSRTNFSCYAYNEGGNGIHATIELDVYAPPAFINKLVPYTGVLYSRQNASLMCRVECVPKCSISWFKDGLGIDNSSSRYFIKEKYLSSEPATGDFESLISVLHFNMPKWPQGKFDIYADNANYSCVSSNNSVGPGVRSATYFSIEYPPENTTVSKDVILVEEDNIPERVLCSAKANPEPSYEWRFGDEIIARGSALIINHVMSRADSGPYKCISFNKHGSHSAETIINILYKPTCEIIRKEINDEDSLVCNAFGNPNEADFIWSMKFENDSIELGGGNRIESFSSYLIIDDDFSVSRVYRCIANNSVGSGQFCQIEVAGQLVWWQRWDRTTLIILIASVFSILLAVIIICCIIICICRRKRRQDKYHADMSISATQSVLSYQASPLQRPVQTSLLSSSLQITPDIPKSPPKWPLRPGVMVHIKGDTKQNLRANRLNISQTSDNITISTIESPEGQQNQSINSNINCIETKLGLSKKDNTCIIHVNNDDNKKFTENSKILIESSSPPPPLPRRNKENHKNFINSGNMTTASMKSTHELLPRDCKNSSIQRNLDICQISNENNDDTIKSHQENDNLSLFTKVFGEIFTRQKNECINEESNINSRTPSEIFRNFFGITRIFGSQKNISSSINPFTTDHRLKGLRCSGGVIAYKKTTLLERPLLIDRNINKMPDKNEINKDNFQSTQKMHGKSSSLGDPLTEPGEYENLPFHGLQTVPNKFGMTSINYNNSNNGRVALRPKLTIKPSQQNPINYKLYNRNASDIITNNNFQILQYNQNDRQNINSDIMIDNKTQDSHNSFPANYTEYFGQQKKYSTVRKKNSLNEQQLLYTIGKNMKNPFIVGTKTEKFHTNIGCRQKVLHSNEKKFYSLKMTNSKNISINNCQNQPQLVKNKYKRHNSFTSNPTTSYLLSNLIKPSDEIEKQDENIEPVLVYENLTDSIQIYESEQLYSHEEQQSKCIKGQNQINNEERLDNPTEHHSIYRSDSGISNSSYECSTPIPAPRQILTDENFYTAKRNRKCPIYMNMFGVSKITDEISPNSLKLNPQSNDLSPNNQNYLSNNKNNNHNDNNNSSNSISNNNNDINDSYLNDTNNLLEKTYKKNNHPRQSMNRTNKNCPTENYLKNLEQVPNTNPFLATSSSLEYNINTNQGNCIAVQSSVASSKDFQHKSNTIARNIDNMSLSSSMPFSSPVNSILIKDFTPTTTTGNSTKSTPNTNLNKDFGQTCSTGLMQMNSFSTLSSNTLKRTKINGYNARTLKLPIRKHHSFHIQPTPSTISLQKDIYNTNDKELDGPLVFRPFGVEKKIFKSKSPTIPYNYYYQLVCNPNSVPPRICATNLKRHFSNIESYDSTRYEYKNDTINRRLVYADLAQFNSIPQYNKNNQDLDAEFDDLITNSDSEQLRKRRQPKMNTNSLLERRNCNEINKETFPESSITNKRTNTTQYATLTFNEVSI